MAKTRAKKTTSKKSLSQRKINSMVKNIDGLFDQLNKQSINLEQKTTTSNLKKMELPQDQGEALKLILKKLFEDSSWKYRTFKAIKDQIRDIPDDELRRFLVRRAMFNLLYQIFMEMNYGESLDVN